MIKKIDEKSEEQVSGGYEDYKIIVDMKPFGRKDDERFEVMNANGRSTRKSCKNLKDAIKFINDLDKDAKIISPQEYLQLLKDNNWNNRLPDKSKTLWRC